MKKLLLFIIFGIVFFISILTTYFSNEIMNDFKQSEPYLLIIEKIRNNETAIYIENGQYEVSYLVGGNLNSEKASFHFKIYTPNRKKFVVYADLKKNKEELWEIVNFEAIEK